MINPVSYLQAPRIEREELITFIEQTKIPESLKVGIVWAGSSTHANDHNRSCKIEDFLPVLQIPNITFYSLQLGDRSEDINELPENINIVDVSDRLQDYGDTAVVVEKLDLTICVDTSVAHLAGALGKSIWVALCYNPDWRWLLERNDSPWYPTMKIFRQSQPQDWQSVFSQIAKEITAQKSIIH